LQGDSNGQINFSDQQNGLFIEAIRRFLSLDSPADYLTMIFVSVFALVGNGICLHLNWRLYFLDSNKPDLIIGTAVLQSCPEEL
jgi:hypothetical protein